MLQFDLTAEVHQQLADCPPVLVFNYTGDCFNPDDAYHALDVRLKTLGVIDYKVVGSRFSASLEVNK